jgi:hypothetical protein
VSFGLYSQAAKLGGDEKRVKQLIARTLDEFRWVGDDRRGPQERRSFQ